MYIQDQRYARAKLSATEAKALSEMIGDKDSLWSAEQYLEAIAEVAIHNGTLDDNVADSYQPEPGTNRHYGYPASSAGRGTTARKTRKDDPSSTLFNRKSFPWHAPGAAAGGT